MPASAPTAAPTTPTSVARVATTRRSTPGVAPCASRSVSSPRSSRRSARIASTSPAAASTSAASADAASARSVPWPSGSRCASASSAARDCFSRTANGRRESAASTRACRPGRDLEPELRDAGAAGRDGVDRARDRAEIGEDGVARRARDPVDDDGDADVDGLAVDPEREIPSDAACEPGERRRDGGAGRRVVRRLPRPNAADPLRRQRVGDPERSRLAGSPPRRSRRPRRASRRATRRGGARSSSPGARRPRRSRAR